MFKLIGMVFSMKLFLLAIFYIFSAASVSEEVLFNEKNGLYSITKNNQIILESKYIGWGKAWKWDAPIAKKKTIKNEKIQLNFRRQNIQSLVEIKKNKSYLIYTYNHVSKKTLINTIGIGIEFNLPVFEKNNYSGNKAPKILENNKGWEWEYDKGKVIQVIFSGDVSKIYFEKNKKSKIRVFFYSGNINKGAGSTTMRLNLPFETKTVGHQDAQSIVLKKSKWLREAIDPNTSFIDLSYLNEKPAGKHGFIKAVGDKLMFNDGTQGRFFGTNLQAYSIFIDDKEKIKKHAKRISQLGFNLVRLHHHDSPWVKNKLIKDGETTQEINEKALDSYFWWVKCLQDEGIYIWVDLQVQRPWKEADKIPGWDTDLASKAKKGVNVAKGFIYLNKKMQKLTKKFNENLLTRINPYTKLALKDDPSVMGVLITNENDITKHFGNNFLKNKNNPHHQQLFDNEVDKFSEKFNIPRRLLKKTWVAGPSKLLLNDIEAHFNFNMISHLHNLGIKVPIATTNFWGGNSALYSLPALTTGNIIDSHGYAENTEFKISQLAKNPYYEGNFLHSIGQAQVLNKPFSLSEYNIGRRTSHRDDYLPSIMTASMAAFQGWDAIMLYGYSQDGFRGGRVSQWSSYNHPTIMGVIPAMALLYRERHVKQAKKTVVLAPQNQTIFTKTISPETSIAIRTALEQHRLVVALPKNNILPWLKKSVVSKNVQVVENMNKSLLADGKEKIISDTGEITRNWVEQTLIINTEKTQAVIGKIGGKTIELKDIKVIAENKNAAIIFTSLDNHRIKASNKILVSAVANAENKKNKFSSVYISEPVKSDITFTSERRNVRVIALKNNGSEGQSLPLMVKPNNKYFFSISASDKTHWYLITSEK